MTDEPTLLNLAHWRREVSEMYADVRRNPDPYQAWCHFRATRDRLFLTHPQTPLTGEQLAWFRSLSMFDYDPHWRLFGRIDRAVTPDVFALMLRDDGGLRYRRVAHVHFEVAQQARTLSLFWIEGYGGGLFLPFRDLTNGQSTFGAGRYLYDTIKGADLGAGETTIVLDFNFAYNPSCAYNDQWYCPLAPPENRLDIAVTAGERTYR